MYDPAGAPEQRQAANVELAPRVHLSPSPCLARIRSLEERGVIDRYVALLDPHAVGLNASVFIQISLEKQTKDALDIFVAAIGRGGLFMRSGLR
jgi:Lrp/AsnC family leucine-responsive transcriptional regulator